MEALVPPPFLEIFDQLNSGRTAISCLSDIGAVASRLSTIEGQ